jgi:hypothetical protein
MTPTEKVRGCGLGSGQLAGLIVARVTVLAGVPGVARHRDTCESSALRYGVSGGNYLGSGSRE